MRSQGFGFPASGVRSVLVGGVLALAAGCGGGETAQRDFLAPPPASSQVAASIVVSPKQPTIFEADSLRLSAVVLNVAQSPVTADVDWRVSGPSGASISSTGVFRPAGAGAYRVVAWVRSNPILADSTDITVVSAVLQALTISPRTVDLDAGGTATFTVQAVWNVNAPGLPQPIVDFSATGGTIDNQGRFVAGPVAGTFQVRVRHRMSAVGDSATVQVRTAAPVSIAVSPSQLTMSPGAVRIFQATATLSGGTTAPAQVTWTATGNGTITPQGFFTAGAAGSGATAQVTATVLGTSVSGTAAVTISQPTATLTAVEVLPGSASLPAGGSLVLTAQGRFSDGSTTTLPVTWTATGGTITSVGVYTAGSQAGPFRVVAVAANGSGLADTVPVAVTAATVTGLQVSPGAATVAPGGTQQFAVSATWSDGVSRPAPAVAWTATGGAVTPSGLYTAGSTPGTWAVTASASGVSAQVLVTVSSPPPPAAATITSLVVSPGSAEVIAGQSRQFTARATWSDGVVTTPQVVWSATGGSITDGGLYAASLQGGSRRVIARISGGTLADTAEVSVVAVTQFVLNPGSVSLETGKTQQFTTSVLWSDGSTSRPVVVLYSASGGAMISSGLYTAGQVAGLFSVIASCNGCGKADTSVVTLTSPSASQPVLTSLAIEPSSVSLAANATQQFIVSATWSDGSSTVPSLSWSVVGIGSVDQSGSYTASSNAGSAEVIALHSSGKADTSFVTITSSAPPPVQGQIGTSGAGPNQPAGMTPLFDNPMSDPLTFSANQYGFRDWSPGGAGRVTYVTDSNGDQVYRGTTPANKQQFGASDWTYSAGAGPFPGKAKVLYTRIRFRFSPNFSYDTGGKIKWFSPRMRNTVASNSFLMIQSAGRPTGQFGFTWLQQIGGALGSDQQTMPKANGTLFAGQVYEGEFLFDATNGPGAGVLKIWINGQLWWTLNNVNYHNAGEDPSWDNIWVAFMYSEFSQAGVMANSSGDQYFDTGHWYASVR